MIMMEKGQCWKDGWIGVRRANRSPKLWVGYMDGEVLGFPLLEWFPCCMLYGYFWMETIKKNNTN